MKKKNLKTLKLNKKSISSLQKTNSIVGGSMGSCYAPCPDISGPKGPCLPTYVGQDCNSDNGCITNTDQTMTCPDATCNCNVIV